MAIDKVKQYFKKYKMEDKILEFEVSSATVELAAKALKCEPAHIAKSLSFDINGNTILIVAAGNVKVDNAKYRSEFRTKAKMLKFNEVESRIGHAVGGVCPFAVNNDVKVYLDNSLNNFKYVYPACGSSNSAIKLTIPELEKYSNYIKWIDVTKKDC